MGVYESEEVDDVDEDPEDEGGAYSPIQARCPASSLERSKAKGTVIPLGMNPPLTSAMCIRRTLWTPNMRKKPNAAC